METPDDSRNHRWVALFIVGEGYQNTHYAYPASANFADAPGEFDSGYIICRVFEKLGLLTINPETVIPRHAREEAT